MFSLNLIEPIARKIVFPTCFADRLTGSLKDQFFMYTSCSWRGIKMEERRIDTALQDSVARVLVKVTFIIWAVVPGLSDAAVAQEVLSNSLTYRHIQVEEEGDRIVAISAVAEGQNTVPLWARDVTQKNVDWSRQKNSGQSMFLAPIPFVLEPEDKNEPFYSHNHQPSITWLPNGDLLAIWYSTEEEAGTELTVLASRMRSGGNEWDPSSEFFKAANHNMHGSSIFHDGNGTIYHINSMAPGGNKGWARLAILMRASRDNGVTWTYKASPFPPIGGGQRLVLKQLAEGPLLFVSFTSGNRSRPEDNGLLFVDQNGNKFIGHGLYACVSFDRGKTWPVRKLLTPGKGQFNGGAWTGEFVATPTRAEHAGYLAVTQTPDGVVHLISSRLHYRFNLAWLTAGTVHER